LSELKLPEFKENFGRAIGYNGVFKFIKVTDSFAEFSAEIPKVKIQTKEKCHDCNGTGKRGEPWDDDKCLFCEGTGLNYIMNWKGAQLVSASLTVLMSWLRYPKIDTTAKLPQLLTLQTITQCGPHGGSLSGEISIYMKDILASFLGKVRFTEITDAMRSCYDQMVGLREFHKWSFDAYIENGRFIINCPGDACGLHPSDWYERKGEGFEFSCHNVDSSIQQLTLIAGLAKLCDLVRDRE